VIYQIIAALIFFVALITVVIAAKLLINSKWILGFLRGAVGLALLLSTAFLCVSANDILGYKGSESGKSIATISFRKKEANNYQVDIKEVGGETYTVDLEGQQWKLNARMYKWSPMINAMGFRTGYRLDDVSARYLELQMDNLVGKREPAKLNKSTKIDIWEFLYLHPIDLLAVEAYVGSPGFTPVADGAIFDIVLTGLNLTANPLNDVAKSAVKSW
jgi:hypothetical protein